MALCKKMKIDKDVCYLDFGKDTMYKTTKELGFTTRGELVLADIDTDGNIKGIELIRSEEAEKPCQGGEQ